MGQERLGRGVGWWGGAKDVEIDIAVYRYWLLDLMVVEECNSWATGWDGWDCRNLAVFEKGAICGEGSTNNNIKTR